MQSSCLFAQTHVSHYSQYKRGSCFCARVCVFKMLLCLTKRVQSDRLTYSPTKCVFRITSSDLVNDWDVNDRFVWVSSQHDYNICTYPSICNFLSHVLLVLVVAMLVLLIERAIVLSAVTFALMAAILVASH